MTWIRDHVSVLGWLAGVGSIGMVGCTSEPEPEPEVAEGIFARLGEPLPSATPEELETFDRGREVAKRRFTPDDGLGPTGNVTFCGSCHERPVLGGAAPRYRDFYLTGQELDDGSFLPGGTIAGVLASYGFSGETVRPGRSSDDNVSAVRSPIPFFGVGLLAELPDEVILANEDPDDEDGDGISGRANYDRGFVGRFGRKSQTVSIEGFIRGPLNNHLGITTDPLPDDLKARLPVPSAEPEDDSDEDSIVGFDAFRQAAAPDEPLADADDVDDPELPAEDLFDLVAFSMLTAAPEPESPTEASERGAALFEEIGCDDCHVRGLVGPRGLLPLYSDLLLHDMGEDLADGIQMKLASGSEFRTQPLWGVAAAAPYLHDGRADTLDDAIRMHGGEGEASADAYADLRRSEREDVVAFLESLGGLDQRVDGLLPPDAPVPPARMPGAPRELSRSDLETWMEGRALFDRDSLLGEGLGPKFNGDSCRACHIDPVVGGAGPAGVDVMRYGTLEDAEFVAPSQGTILHKLTTWNLRRTEHGEDNNVFERRQTPTLLGLGLIEEIDEQAILARQDPDDADADGIRGIAQILPDGRLGRFGWKAQVPSVREFVRDALGAEMGVTSPEEDGLTFGVFEDDDDVPDPEVDVDTIDKLTFFIANLDRPHPSDEEPRGEEVFTEVGCDGCHVPELPSSQGDVPLYSDLLLHSVAPAGAVGIDDGLGTQTLFRTPPLWGLRDTMPYMHNGSAQTIRQAIEAHAGEAEAVRRAFDDLDDDDAEALITFVETR